MIIWARHTLTSDPNGEAICDYLRNDPWLLGDLFVPKKYQAKHVKSNRAGKYDDYLRRGLPVPEQFLPNAEESVLNQRKANNGAVLIRIATEGFEPHIRMPALSQQEELPTVSKPETTINPSVNEESKMQRKCKSTHGHTDYSHISSYVGHS